jgi:hypothetical protein
MMGERLVMQESLFYAFRLEDHVPCDHLLRRIDRFVDCSGLRQHLALLQHQRTSAMTGGGHHLHLS